jgi:L-lactate dehydrogenase (cytochrome)
MYSIWNQSRMPFYLAKLGPFVSPPFNFKYYSSGSDDELTLRENHAAFHRILFRPRVLIDVSHVSLSTKFFGSPTALPIYITACALGKLGHPNGETELTIGAGNRGIVQMMPTLASCSVNEMADKAIDGQVLWFQMYVNASRKVVKEMLERVWGLGVRVVCLTVDAPTLGKREKDMRVKFVDGLILRVMCRCA